MNKNESAKKIDIIQELGISVKEPDKEAMEKAQKQWDSVAKPLHSLGKLEDMVVQLAGIYRTSQIDISKRGVLVYCADNGVVEEGVSQSGSEVTALVAKSLADGRSNVNIMAKSMGAEVFPVDVGIKTELNYPGILQYKISQGTKNIAKEPDMTAEQCLQVIRTGTALVGKKKAEGINILAIGEMGIGNTTTSSAVASVLVQKPIADMTGRGAGLSTEGLEKKKQVIAKAIALHQPDKEEPFQVLCSLGGYDIAAMAGTCIGGMVYDIPVVLDGIISTVAALVAVRMVPECRPYLLASHVSKEPAGAYVLEALGMEAVLHADMCLGEGTGAVLLFPILEAALAEYRSAHTFHEIALEPYEKLL